MLILFYLETFQEVAFRVLNKDFLCPEEAGLIFPPVTSWSLKGCCLYTQILSCPCSLTTAVTAKLLWGCYGIQQQINGTNTTDVCRCPKPEIRIFRLRHPLLWYQPFSPHLNRLMVWAPLCASELFVFAGSWDDSGSTVGLCCLWFLWHDAHFSLPSLHCLLPKESWPTRRTTSYY